MVTPEVALRGRVVHVQSEAEPRLKGERGIVPERRTQGDSALTGEPRAARVGSVGLDLATFDVDFSAAGRPLRVMLDTDGDRNPDGDWNDAVMNVARLPFLYGDPTILFIL